MLGIVLLGADKYWDSLAFASIRAVVVAATKPVESERNEGFALDPPVSAAAVPDKVLPHLATYREQLSSRCQGLPVWLLRDARLRPRERLGSSNGKVADCL
jgi:hypothetical protein